MNFLDDLSPLIGFAQNFVPKHRVIFVMSEKSKSQLTEYEFEDYQLNDLLLNLDKDLYSKDFCQIS